jgi:glyoxylase-like metal-dependent hydrolase (beta-lactamase superfamily II)
MKTLHFGDIRVDRLVEVEGPSFFPAFMLPDCTPEALAAQRDWIEPHFFDPVSGRFIQSVHAYVLRTRHHTILVDTCIGNDKNRPSTKPWHRMQTGWLDQLKAMGVPPEAVDFVLCTHLHVDHIGWNTRLVNGRWVPTFPNAKYLFCRQEYEFWAGGQTSPEGRSGAADGSFQDSVLPVVEAGQALLVAGDHAIDDNLRLEPTPGHSPGHVCLHLSAGGGHAVFSGDLMHHPVQCAHPEWNSRFCHDLAASRAQRIRFVERHADSDAIILAAHFAAPTVGRIVGNGGRCKFRV